MAQYIDKSAVIAEIDKLQDSTMDEDGNFYTAKAQAEYNILCILENSINNIEVKEETISNVQKASLWKDAQGDDLPEIDREVVALVQDYPDDAEHLRIAYAHRPPEYWDGKNILTGEVTRYEPKRYDKGDWNLPNVKYWLDVELPKGE